MSEVRDQVLARAKAIAEYGVRQIEAGKHAGFALPERSKTNLVFDRASNSYVLGPRQIVRTTRNPHHLKSLARMMWLNKIVIDHIETGKTTTLRDLYYMSQHDEDAAAITFKRDNDEKGLKGAIDATALVTAMETLYGFPHEAFGIYPKAWSRIFGKAEVQYTDLVEYTTPVKLNSIPGGYFIDTHLASANLVSCNATSLFAIEKGAIFDKLIEEKWYERYNAVLLDLGGTGPSAAKLMAKRLVDRYSLKAYVIADGDPWGLHIARTFIVGSAKTAHLRLNVPNARFLGMTPQDIVDYNLTSMKLSEQDRARIAQLLEDPRYQDPTWKQYLLDYARLGKKAELEAFSKSGNLAYVINDYLPKKLEAIEN